MHQPRKPPQHVQIPQFRHRIPRQHKRAQHRQALRHPRLDPANPVPRTQQRLQARRQREVCEDGDVVVGEVYAFLVARGAQVLERGDFVA